MKPPDFLDDLHAQLQHAHHLRIRPEIDIALPVAQLDIGEPSHFAGGGSSALAAIDDAVWPRW